MSKRNRRLVWVLAASVLAASCDEPEPAPVPRTQAEPACDAAGVRQVVERLGERMKEVPLLAPDSVVIREIREAYAPLVTPDLLETWMAEPTGAPGRSVSSPWPERIEVRSVEAAGEGSCRVEGEVVYLTSVESAQGGVASREPVTLRVVEDDGWRVGAYAAAGPPASDPDSTAAPADAAEVVRRYYAAIAAGDYPLAYSLWSDGGAASGQTLEEFAGGFAETARVEAEVGAAGRVEGAAGSRYVEVPVVIEAVTTSGAEQRFEGSYTLRRSVADGASAEQRRWHIHSADVTRTR